jgi:hypothetical protein
VGEDQAIPLTWSAAWTGSKTVRLLAWSQIVQAGVAGARRGRAAGCLARALG